MRITASWFQTPLLGSGRIQGCGRDLRWHPWAGSPQIVSALLAARGAIATGCADPDAVDTAAVLGAVKEWPSLMGPLMSSTELPHTHLSLLQRVETSDVMPAPSRRRILPSLRGQHRGCRHDAFR